MINRIGGISLWYEDKLKELKDSGNISYDDVLYIIPFHLISRNNNFSDLKKIRVVSVETRGHNTRGCEVTGKFVTYDKDSFPVEEFYSGNAIYRYKAGGGVITQDGIKFPLYSREQKFHILTSRPLVQLWCRFRASEGLYVEIPVAKGMYFNRRDDAIAYGLKHYFYGCLLYVDKIECMLDGYKVIFNEYNIIQDESVFSSRKAKNELWGHMLANEEAKFQNKYGMAYSKVFSLTNDCIVARRSTGEFLGSAKYPVRELFMR